jgi:inosose dehydratase
MKLKVGNAPCSWGKIENTEGDTFDYATMLDELAATGYTGTELGDWGYMPTDPAALLAELAQRQLEMIGSWVTVRLYDEAAAQARIPHVLKVARLLKATGGQGAVINIGDDHSTVETRHYHTGRIQPEHGLSDEAWPSYIRGLEGVAKAVKDATGLRCGLHHHGSTYVETVAEIEHFLAISNPELVDLCFDTGHYALGGGNPVEGLERYAERISLVHFKDFDPGVVEQAKQHHWNYQDMVGAGVFPRLGEGIVDFPAVLETLTKISYEGWIVVEQDVLPGMGNPKENARANRDYLASIGL